MNNVEEQFSIATRQNMVVEVKNTIDHIANSMKDKIVQDIEENLKLESDFSFNTFCKAFDIRNDEKNVFHSSYQDEILSKVRLLMRLEGYRCSLEYNDDNKRVYYTARVVTSLSLLKKMFSVVVGMGAAYVMMPYMQQKMQEMRHHYE